MSASEFLDLAGCAQRLGLRPRALRRLVRRGEFCRPAGKDGDQFWREADVLRWAARQAPPLPGRVPIQYWPDPVEPATYVGAERLAARYGRDDAVLRWQTTSGSVVVVWRPDDPIMLGLHELIRKVDADVVLTVDPDFGLDGPTLRALHRARPDDEYGPGWAELARVLGQPVPYWPHALRDPDLIAAWTPGAPTLEVAARPDLDIAPLLHMSAQFHPTHATSRTLFALARLAQYRVTRDALADLDALVTTTNRRAGERAATAGAGRSDGGAVSNPNPATVVVAARPLIGDGAEIDEPDDTTRRIGLRELLGRSDPLSRRCVDQIRDWDGGRNLPFAGLTDLEADTAHALEWSGRLQPVEQAGAVFTFLDQDDVEDIADGFGPGRPLIDPVTEAPVLRRGNGTLRTLSAQRLPTTSPLAELVIARPFWVRTADGTLYLAPHAPGAGLLWGYHGSSPDRLARLVDRLLADITADAATLYDQPAPDGLVALTQLPWRAGTVLDRELLEAARDGRPWTHPDRPEPE